MQVLTQCREHLIDKTFQAIEGIRNVIVHIYNSTSTLQRDVVFHMDREEIKKIAVEGTRMVKERAAKFPGNIQLEYSPESFTGTEVDFALDICTAVQDVWEPTVENKLIFNLPATVEMNTPNVYADQIEWMHRHFKDRDKIILSIHPHNDRGTGIAATELALMAGADRVEGTLFGNGERTGNIDILNVAYNMFSQGINPKLDLEDIKEIIDVYERCTKMTIDMRHPYAGKLVFTAFSGSHQDAINKGVKALHERQDCIWEVPYLPIDPSDVGRKYEPIVRINSQSGKGGVAFIMDTMFGFQMPKAMHKEFADVIQKLSEQQGGEVDPQEMLKRFQEEYLYNNAPFEFVKIKVEDIGEKDSHVVLDYRYNGKDMHVEADGNGPIDAVKLAIIKNADVDVSVLDYSQHALGSGSNAKSAAYIQMRDNRTGSETFGVGVSSNITRASIRSFFSALNRLHK